LQCVRMEVSPYTAARHVSASPANTRETQSTQARFQFNLSARPVEQKKASAEGSQRMNSTSTCAPDGNQLHSPFGWKSGISFLLCKYSSYIHIICIPFRLKKTPTSLSSTRSSETVHFSWPFSAPWATSSKKNSPSLPRFLFFAFFSFSAPELWVSFFTPLTA